jgi:hypothetical protein
MPHRRIPSHLSKPSQAWVRELLDALDFETAEWHLVVMAAESRDRAATARRLLEREGLTVRTPILNRKGDVVGERLAAHPAVVIAKDAVAQYAQLVKQLDLPELLDDAPEAPATVTPLREVS